VESDSVCVCMCVWFLFYITIAKKIDRANEQMIFANRAISRRYSSCLRARLSDFWLLFARRPINASFLLLWTAFIISYHTWLSACLLATPICRLMPLLPLHVRRDRYLRSKMAHRLSLRTFPSLQTLRIHFNTRFATRERRQISSS